MHAARSLIVSALALSTAALVTAQTPAVSPAPTAARAGSAAPQTTAAPKAAPPAKLTIDQLVQIKHPSGHQWTPDGRHVWWTYDDGGINNIWTAPADGSGQPVALTTYPDGQAGGGGFWSRDGQTFFYQRGGELLAVSVTGGAPHPAWPSAAGAGSFTLSPDGTRVAFIVGQGGGRGGGAAGGGAAAAGGAGGARGGGRGGRGAAGAAGAGAAATSGAAATTGAGATAAATTDRTAAAQAAPASNGADLIVHTIATNSDQRITHAAGRIGGMSWSPDSTRLAYTTTGGATAELKVATIAGGTEATIVSDPGPIGAPSWTPDAALLIYTVGGGGGGGGGPIQHQVSPPEIGNKLIFVSTEGGRGGGGGGETFMVPSGGGTPKSMSAGGRAGGGGGGGGGRGGGNWLDATHTLSSRTSNNGKTRTAEAMDINGGAPKLLHEESEDKFFSAVNNTTSAISPDHHWLLFTADTTGWDQIYVMPTSGGTPVQITKTLGDHWRAVWSHDSRHIAWDTDTAEKPGDRHIEFATIGDASATSAAGSPASTAGGSNAAGVITAPITIVTSGTGTNTAPQWSPDDTRILYQHTDAQYSPELYVSAAAPAASAKPTRLTSSMPASVDHSMFVAPELVHYPGPDGKPVPAWLFVPKNLDRTKRHPAIVWIHPDGVNQNYDGFHPDRNEGVYYEFHQYLLQQGYVVIAPDYRGSIGYGRDWRNDVYMDVGGNDAKDARMAATYLKTLGYIDGARLGVWGLSYGGFFTLQAITQEPTWFRAAVDVAGVTDYALYYEDPYHGGWTTSRIGTPEEHPDVYAKAAPMFHVDQIQHPLLILHGTADVNVPFIESMLLIDHLMKAGKGDLVTFMVYPGEFHYFDRAFVVRDAWHRVDDFFRTNLHPELATTK